MATESTETTDPNPSPENFFSLQPPTFSGEGGDTTSEAGLRGSVLSVFSVAHPGWGGRVENRPSNHLPRNSRKNLKLWGRGSVLGTGLDNEGVLQPRR